MKEQILNFIQMEYSEYIIIDKDVRFGKAIIKGTRITVFDVLNWMANGMNVSDIISSYPELTENQIRACLAFAADKEQKAKIAS